MYIMKKTSKVAKSCMYEETNAVRVHLSNW